MRLSVKRRLQNQNTLCTHFISEFFFKPFLPNIEFEYLRKYSYRNFYYATKLDKIIKTSSYRKHNLKMNWRNINKRIKVLYIFFNCTTYYFLENGYYDCVKAYNLAFSYIWNFVHLSIMFCDSNKIIEIFCGLFIFFWNQKY